MIKNLTCALSLVLLLSACKKDTIANEQEELGAELEQMIQSAHINGKSAFILPDSDDYSSIPQDPQNPITTEKVELGRMLYHDPSFGVNPEDIRGMSSYSCASCHFAEGGFAARKAQGIGEGGLGTSDVARERTKNAFYAMADIDVQPIKSPSTLNTAYQELMLWNGQFGAVGDNIGTESEWTAGTPKEKNHLGFEGVETQAIAGIEVHRLLYNDSTVLANGYQSFFDDAYPDIASDERYSNLTAALAIAAYERTLLPNEAPFQRWLKGNDLAMTPAQLEGAKLFFGDGNCIDCHTGPALNAMEFSAIGMNDLWETSETVFNVNADNVENLGRGGFTKNPEDNHKFKVPQLYNLHDSPFFGHGASFTNLFDVIKYKNIANPQNKRVPETQIDEHFTPLGLSDDEIELIAEFVEFGLRDTDLNRYLPHALPSGSCFPNGDELSAFEMGCN